MNLTCSKDISQIYSSISSIYFIGYGIGAVLYWMPDELGRQLTLQYVMPVQVLAYFLVVFSSDFLLKNLGSFCMGLFHIKLTVCYTYIYEMVQDEHRVLCSTVLNFVDDSSLAVMGCILYFGDHNRDIDLIFQWHWTIGTVAVILQMLLLPESPKWLFYMEGADSKRGIDAINYIAWANGSVYRVPSCAKLDLVG